MCRNVSARVVVRQVAPGRLDQLGVVAADDGAVDAVGQERWNSENFVLVANIAVLSPAPSSDENTEPTGCPAAACTVRGTSRSSSQVTPCPP